MHCYIINIKAIGFMVSEDFLKIFPIITYKEANDRPSGHGQVVPQGHGWGTVGMIQNIAIY